MKKADKIFLRVGQALSSILTGASIAAVIVYGFFAYTITALILGVVATVSYSVAIGVYNANESEV